MQILERAKTLWDDAGESILVEIKTDEFCKVSQLHRYDTRDFVAVHFPAQLQNQLLIQEQKGY